MFPFDPFLIHITVLARQENYQGSLVSLLFCRLCLDEVSSSHLLSSTYFSFLFINYSALCTVTFDQPE